MRTKKSYLSVLAVVSLLVALFSSVGSAAASPKESKMQSYVDAMQPGWNLGNTFDSFNTNAPNNGDETSWGNPVVTKAFLKEIKQQGFKSIRIPITGTAGWEAHLIIRSIRNGWTGSNKLSTGRSKWACMS